MFARFGRFAQKYKWYILAFWLAFTVFMVIQAPLLSDVGVTDQSQFLPSKTESVYARNLLNEKFGSGDTNSSSGLIVVYNANGLTAQDMNNAKALHDWLVSTSRPSNVKSVASIFESESLSATLVSADNTTMMMNVYFSVAALSDTAKQAILEIRAQFKQYPESTFYLSGSAGLLYDMFDSVH